MSMVSHVAKLLMTFYLFLSSNISNAQYHNICPADRFSHLSSRVIIDLLAVTLLSVLFNQSDAFRGRTCLGMSSFGPCFLHVQIMDGTELCETFRSQDVIFRTQTLHQTEPELPPAPIKSILG